MKRLLSHGICAAILLGASGLCLAEGVRVPVTFEAPGRGFVSLALYDQDGVLARSLLYARPVEAGTRTITWDATTDLGVPAAPGTYTARGVFFTEPPSLAYLRKVGKSGNPPYRTADGKGDWGGNLGIPTSLCSNGKTIMMVWGTVEDNQITGIQQMDADGTIAMRYYSFYPWDTRMASAMDDEHFYLGIQKLDEGLEVAEYKLGEPRGKILAKLPSKPHPMKSGRWKGRPMAYVDGMALTRETIYASVAEDDVLFLIDRGSGRIRKQVSVPSPHGLAVSEGRLLVVSGKRVLRLGLDGEADSTLVEEGVLDAPNALAVDVEGNLYVGESGANLAGDPEWSGGHQQVFVFDADGKLLRKLGKEGGTPRNGRYDGNGFGDITGLCVGPDGETLFVNDVATGFMRTSRWSLDGRLERKWFGRGSVTHVNSARPSELLDAQGFGSDFPGLSAYEVDFRARTWKPAWHFEQTYAEMQQPPVFVGFAHGGNPFRQFQEGSDLAKGWPILDLGATRFAIYKGRHYFMNNEGAFFTYDGESKPRLVALAYMHRGWKEGDRIECAYDQGRNAWFAWADRDGDGRVEVEESTFTEGPPMLERTPRVWSATLDDQLNILLKRFVNTAPGRSVIVDSVLPLKEVLPNGAPVYDWSLLKDVVKPQMPDLNGGDGTKRVANVLAGENVTRGDAVYCLIEPQSETPLKLPGIDGEGWWASRNWRKKLARFDATTGRCLWAVGRRAPSVAEPGQMYNPISLSGEAGGALFLADALGVVWAWSTDGLYLGRLYNGPEDRRPDANGINIELQRSLIDVDPSTGEIYSIVTDNGASVHEVKLPKLQPLSGGTVTVTPEQAERARPWDPDGADPAVRPTSEAPSTSRPIDVNGLLEEWGATPDGRRIPEMVVMLDDKVRAMYDNKDLYLAYQVWAPNGPINSGSELPDAPFVSGAYVDFSVAPEWSAPGRPEVHEGDVRVILARVRNGPAGEADYQEGFWPRKTGGENPQTIRSPAASVHFDQIKPLPGLKAAFRSSEKGADGTVFYEVEVAVPLASLGLEQPAGRRVGFDASVGIANASGDRRERAAHWSGQSEAAVVDRPGSARLLPETWGTLSFQSAGSNGN